MAKKTVQKTHQKSTKKVYLAASLVCANMLDLKGEIAKLEKGGADYIHFDVMDNRFVPRYGLHPEILEAIKKITKIPIDVHLMVEHPEDAIEAFAKAGADIIVVHAESTPHLHRVLKLIKNLGVKAGVALNPATSLDVLDYIMDDLDLVLLMAINPGILGHKLIPEMLDKISSLKKKIADQKKWKTGGKAAKSEILIEIDGGVTPESIPLMVSRGANMLVCGTGTIFKPEGDVDRKLIEIRKLI